MIYNVVSISAVQQSDFFFSYYLPLCSIPRDCYTVKSHCLAILNAIVCIYSPQTPCPSPSIPFPLGNKSALIFYLRGTSRVASVLGAKLSKKAWREAYHSSVFRFPLHLQISMLHLNPTCHCFQYSWVCSLSR